MFRLLKPGVVGENTGKKLMSVELSKPENQLSDLLIEVGETTCKKALKKLKPGQEKGLLIDMRRFYQTTTKYLMDHLPVGSGIVKDIFLFESTAAESRPRNAGSATSREKSSSNHHRRGVAFAQ